MQIIDLTGEAAVLLALQQRCRSKFPVFSLLPRNCPHGDPFGKTACTTSPSRPNWSKNGATARVSPGCDADGRLVLSTQEILRSKAALSPALFMPEQWRRAEPSPIYLTRMPRRR